jgi:AcrR family transcriptional regulator
LRATFELARAGSDAADLAKEVRDRLIPGLADHLPGQDHIGARVLTDLLGHWAYNAASGWLPERSPSDVAAVLTQLVAGGLYADAATVPAESEAMVAERSQNPRPAFEPFIEWKTAASKDEPRSRRGRQTWEAIREAAVRVLSDRSLSDVTALDIAREAGVSSGTVYRYFVDKEDIFRSLQSSAEHDIVRETHLPLDRGRLAVTGMLLAYLDVYRRHIALFRAWQDLLHHRTEMAEAWVGMRNRFIDTATRAIRFGQRAGIADPDLPADLVAEIHSITYEAVAYSRLILGWDIDATDARVAAVVERLFIGGLSQRG